MVDHRKISFCPSDWHTWLDCNLNACDRRLIIITLGSLDAFNFMSLNDCSSPLKNQKHKKSLINHTTNRKKIRTRFLVIRHWTYHYTCYSDYSYGTIYWFWLGYPCITTQGNLAMSYYPPLFMTNLMRMIMLPFPILLSFSCESWWLFWSSPCNSCAPFKSKFHCSFPSHDTTLFLKWQNLVQEIPNKIGEHQKEMSTIRKSLEEVKFEV